MSHITFDHSKISKFVQQHEINNLQQQISAADSMLRNGTGAGSDFLGWIDLPKQYNKEEFSRIKRAAEKIQKDSEVLIVLGIG